MPTFVARVHSAVLMLIGCCSREATVEAHASKRCLNRDLGPQPCAKESPILIY